MSDSLPAFFGDDGDAWRHTPLRDLTLPVNERPGQTLRLEGRAEVRLELPSQDGVLTLSRHHLEIAPGAEILIIDDGLGHATGAHVTLRVGRGARVGYVRRAFDSAWSLGVLDAHVEADASLALHSIVARSGAARYGATVRLNGTGAAVTADALFTPAAGESHDHRFEVVHSAPRTRSATNARTVVADGGVGSFVAKVVIGRHVGGCNAQQLIKALLDGPNAVANLRPELQIDCDDVVASHGAAIGRLDPAQRFYLESRGLPPDEARATLVLAFLRELAARLPHDAEGCLERLCGRLAVGGSASDE